VVKHGIQRFLYRESSCANFKNYKFAGRAVDGRFPMVFHANPASTPPAMIPVLFKGRKDFS